ncbi:AAA family ATPase [Solirubrobacter ginsenosidimutans]|uniref:AAA family ATPase n=1 Tax=Solirubrobacter ginsenosidimutans TaxID=490573 RepID=A0A9X3MSY9_9ACTN|nr:AAA family ATPase [Solirubrobacter ginsenosidimutans]MDA0160653.1 AAA family ATPase [Solirubrobacter ginsenosidimutans]
MFHVTLWLEDGRKLDLEDVKILQLGMGTSGRAEPPQAFEQLPEDFCSLGQATSYYEALQAAGSTVATDYLRRMRDISASPAIDERFSPEPGYATSLFRFPAAHQAYVLGRELFSGTEPDLAEGQLSFSYQPHVNNDIVSFNFGAHDPLPTRLIAVIGYNGVGKTRLLANLAMVAAADDHELSTPEFEQYGAFDGDRPKLGAVIAVSYSAFDDFPVPGQGAFEASEAALEQARDRTGQTSARRYTYIGLRRIGVVNSTAATELKSLSDIVQDFHVARELASTKLREGQLRLILEPIFDEPSFAMVGEMPEVDSKRDSWDDAFTRLSAGHKIVLNIVVQLCARLERRTLVLIDEPEMHLHPPLVAALLKSIGAGLKLFDSFGIVATHSPVVVQEIPGRNVLVLRRHGRWLRVEAPEIETFGENVSLLTTEIFNLDNSDRDFQGVLRALAATHSLERIEALFGGRISSQGRAIIRSEKRGLEQLGDADA